MKITYDPETDALNIKFQKGKYKKSIEATDGIIIDYSEDEKIMSIEILNTTEKIPPEAIKEVKNLKTLKTPT